STPSIMREGMMAGGTPSITMPTTVAIPRLIETGTRTMKSATEISIIVSVIIGDGLSKRGDRRRWERLSGRSRRLDPGLEDQPVRLDVVDRAAGDSAARPQAKPAVVDAGERDAHGRQQERDVGDVARKLEQRRLHVE